MKKIAIFVLLLTAKFSLAAGAYVGVGIGGNALKGAQKSHFDSMLNGESHLNHSMSNFSPSAEALAGYGYAWGSAYLGAEANLSLMRLSAKSVMSIDGGGKVFTLKIKDGFGAAVRAGYYLTPNTLLYVRGGVESRKIGVDFHDKVNDLIALKKSYRGVAFAPGIGLETRLSASLKFRLEGKAELYRQKRLTIARNARNYTRLATKPRLYGLTIAIAHVF